MGRGRGGGEFLFFIRAWVYMKKRARCNGELRYGNAPRTHTHRYIVEEESFAARKTSVEFNLPRQNNKSRKLEKKKSCIYRK